MYRYCRKSAECCKVLQNICRYCRKSAVLQSVAENLQSVGKCCRKCTGIVENLQVLQNSCRTEYRERINEQWKSYYTRNKEQINQRLPNQRQTKIGARNQEPKKLETSLVPSGTFCGTLTVKTEKN